jgi:predicted O-methyltransferase YrrM
MRKAGVLDKIRIIQGDSVKVARNWALPVELLFIDGSHDYDAVKADLEMWLPHVVPGGFVALHDAGGYWPDPTRLAHEVFVCNQTTRFFDVRVIDSLCHARVRMKKNYPLDHESVNGGLPWTKPF